MFGTLIDYWHLTGDDTYNAITMQAMTHQAAPTMDYMPMNQSRTLGNDDQGFWALAAMSAAENVFPNPPKDQVQWLSAAQAVFNEYTRRWNASECGGGLRWQIFTFNAGYNYKNSISNGCFFNLAARLARYTGNSTYQNWAEEIYNWVEGSGLMTPSYQIWDGIDWQPNNNTCSQITDIQWTYNTGMYMHGAAAMYNMTNNSTWKARIDGLINDTQSVFTQNNILYEQFCEPHKLCNVDQQSFKGYILRFMASTTQLATYTAPTLLKLIANSGTAAAAACVGPASAAFKGIDGTGCGFTWLQNGFDGINGVGEQMNALSAIMYNLIGSSVTPATANKGGTSPGDPSAGSEGDNSHLASLPDITTADRAGAGIVTAVLIALLGGFVFFLISDKY